MNVTIESITYKSVATSVGRNGRTATVIYRDNATGGRFEFKTSKKIVAQPGQSEADQKKEVRRMIEQNLRVKGKTVTSWDGVTEHGSYAVR